MSAMTRGSLKRPAECDEESSRLSKRRHVAKRWKARFIWPPLASDTREIRVIRILPEVYRGGGLRSMDGLLQCEIKSVRLGKSQDSSFEALSYTWGNEQSCKAILVNDSILTVRENLWNFLSVSRTTRPNTWLFIDAICIDQTNFTERANQVRLMRKIFSSATQVLIWLGIGDKAITSLMNLAKTVPPLNIIRSPYGFVVRGEDGYLLEPENKSNKVLTAGAGAISSQPYWRRVWIVQEILVASKRVLLHENQELSWKDYLKLAACGKGLIGRDMPFGPKQSRLDLFQMHTPSTSPRVFDVLELLEEFHNNSCSLLHDHVFGILALFQDAGSFPVDYDAGLIELLVNTSLFALNNSADTSPARMISPGIALLQVANSLAWKLKDLSLLRVNGDLAKITLPATSGSILFRLDGTWWKEMEHVHKPSSSFQDSKAMEKMRLDYCTKHFTAGDVFYVHRWTHVILVMRNSPRGMIVVGRIANASRQSEAVSEYGTTYEPRDRDLIGEDYGIKGLYGARLKAPPPSLTPPPPPPFDSSSVADYFDWKESLSKPDFGTLVFNDLRAAVILFALPDDLAIREIAIAMLSEADDKYKFDRTTFSSYRYEEYQKAEEEREAEEDRHAEQYPKTHSVPEPLPSKASKAAKRRGKRQPKPHSRRWNYRNPYQRSIG